MTRLTLFILMTGFLGFLTSCKGKTKEKSSNIETASHKFQVGQVWKYNNRPGEDSSTLTVLKIEKYAKGDTIIHIRVDGIKLHNPKVAGGYSSFIEHLPFSEKAISKSVVKLVGQNNNLPDFSEAYDQWRKVWDNGEAGYWIVDLKEAIAAIDRVMQENSNN